MSIRSTTAPTTDPDAEGAGADVLLGREARRSLSGRLLGALEARGVPYGILRNVDRMLQQGAGDLDLWVPAASVGSALAAIAQEAGATGWIVAKRVERPYASSLYLYLAGPEPSVLTVDVFASIRWYLADIVPERVIAAGRLRAEGRWVIEPSVAALAATLHHLVWNGTAPARYLEGFARADDGRGDLPFVQEVRRLASNDPPDVRALRRSVLLRALGRTLLARPAGAARDAGRIAASGWRAQGGRWISFEGPSRDEHLRLVERELRRSHFMIGRWGSIGRVPATAPARLLWYAGTVAPKRRLGALLLSFGSPGPFRPDVRVVAVERGWRVLDRAGRMSAEGSEPGELVVAVVRSLGSAASGPRTTNRRNGPR